MKPSTEDRAKGKVQEVKGKLKEQAGRITDNPDLEDEGTVEKIGGKVRQVRPTVPHEEKEVVSKWRRSAEAEE
jgi:uncharacterized protein YjbJ (UPF0337 family)